MNQLPRNRLTIAVAALITCPLLMAFIVRWWHSSRSRSKFKPKSKPEEGLEELDQATGNESMDDVFENEHQNENKDVGASGEAVPVVEEEIACEFVGSQLNAQPNTTRSPATPKRGLDFPFLINSETRDYIDKPDSKVMFVMRGLSGSGKSTIVEVLQSTFKGVIVCSADHFFCKKDGKYEFDVKNLKSAHEQCQKKALELCQNGTSVVVIDNTNVQRWEMKAYFKTANTYGYVVVLVEPKTPWRYDAKELFRKSKHGIPLEVLQSKVKAFHDIIPLYYGWFLNQPSSKSLEDIAAHHFKECLTLFPEFKRELLKAQTFSSPRSDSRKGDKMLFDYYSEDRTCPLLHCTALFCDRGRVAVSNTYCHQKNVQAAYGKIYPLVITGLTMTKKTLGARVSLNQECLSLFMRPEEQEWKAEEDDSEDDDFKGGKGKKKKNKTHKTKKTSHLRVSAEEARKRSYLEENFQGAGPEEYDDVADLLHQASLRTKGATRKEGANSEESEDPVSVNDLFPQLHNRGHGRCAHLTIKRARGVEAVTTNFDVLKICDKEQRNNDDHQLPTLHSVRDGKAYHHGDGMCCVYFTQPLVIDALFSAYY